MRARAAVELSRRGGRPRLVPGLGGPITRLGFGQLTSIATAALGFWPPLWVRSVLGPARSWMAPHRELSELSIIDLRRALRSLEYLTAVSVPAVGHRPPAPIEPWLPSPLDRLFWRPTIVFEQPHEGDGNGRHPRERWFYVNGVATNGDVARMNAVLLTRLFGRPITVIQNSTCSLAVDLAECAIGKEFLTHPRLEQRWTFTEPALEATITILEALNDPALTKVVLIAHSQGTVIAANVLRAISRALGSERGRGGRRQLASVCARVAGELTPPSQPRARRLRSDLTAALSSFVGRRATEISKLEKLEVYTFANCADKMRWVARRGNRHYPWLEHFANERDLVARLGVLSPYRDRPGLIAIDGPVYRKSAGGGWGHLLNEHYLFGIGDHLERPDEVENPYPPVTAGDSPSPRLYSYFRGAGPVA